MKKLLFATLLGLLSFGAFANNRVDVRNLLSACPGATVTIQFVSYQEGSCILDIYSPVYTLTSSSTIFDLSDPSLWAPGVLWMPSYESYSAIICITCPDGTQYCLPPVGIDMVAGHACDPDHVGPLPSGCCDPTFAADVIGGGGGGVCFTLNIHP